MTAANVSAYNTRARYELLGRGCNAGRRDTPSTAASAVSGLIDFEAPTRVAAAAVRAGVVGAAPLGAKDGLHYSDGLYDSVAAAILQAL